MIDPLEFYEMLEASKTSEITDLFGDNPLSINTPLEGEISNHDNLGLMALRYSQWVTDFNATLEKTNTIEMDNYQAAEFVLKGDEFELPIALVIQYAAEFEDEELTELGDIISMREYHSTYPLYDSHRVRDPILDPAIEDLEEPEAVENYMEALEEGEPDKVIKVFTPDAYFREPSGSDYLVEGREELHKMYSKILSKGGIQLTHCNAIVDDDTAGIEFIAIKWGDTMLKPQAGIAFYDYTSHGKISAARVYDDVNPPEFD